jgi:four helix bundle protein
MEGQSKYKKLEELRVYLIAMDIAGYIWKVIDTWDYFNKKTIGDQWIKAIDSVAANIAEGHGRYFHKENKNFCRYSRGSLVESKCWLQKAQNRNLITKEQYENLYTRFAELHHKLNAYIKSIGRDSS